MIHLRLDVGGASDVGGSDVGAAGDPCTLSPPPECDGARVHFEYSKVLAQGPDA